VSFSDFKVLSIDLDSDFLHLLASGILLLLKNTAASSQEFHGTR
jgi:hypothetical protein